MILRKESLSFVCNFWGVKKFSIVFGTDDNQLQFIMFGDLFVNFINIYQILF